MRGLKKNILPNNINFHNKNLVEIEGQHLINQLVFQAVLVILKKIKPNQKKEKWIPFYLKSNQDSLN